MFRARRRDRPSGSDRPQWYDRNPISVTASWGSGDIAPHSPTVRISYTCPTVKKAMVESLMGTVRRRTAATTVGSVQSAFRFRPSGGSLVLIIVARITTNSVDDRRDINLGTTLVMCPSDYVEGFTVDTSTGGTCDYDLAHKITEFDA